MSRTAKAANPAQTWEVKGSSSKLERNFSDLWDLLSGMPGLLTPQVYISFERDWRLDLAAIEQLVCIEIQGGSWVMGRHNRPNGMTSDYQKHNAALVGGWRMFYATADMLKTDPKGLIDQMVDAIEKPYPINYESIWTSKIRGLAIGDQIEYDKFIIRRLAQARFMVNDQIIKEPTTREAWLTTLEAVLYWPLTPDEIWEKKQEKHAKNTR